MADSEAGPSGVRPKRTGLKRKIKEPLNDAELERLLYDSDDDLDSFATESGDEDSDYYPDDDEMEASVQPSILDDSDEDSNDNPILQPTPAVQNVQVAAGLATPQAVAQPHNKDKMAVFKSSADTWMGDVEDTNLFYFWKFLNENQKHTDDFEDTDLQLTIQEEQIQESDSNNQERQTYPEYNQNSQLVEMGHQDDVIEIITLEQPEPDREAEIALFTEIAKAKEVLGLTDENYKVNSSLLNLIDDNDLNLTAEDLDLGIFSSTSLLKNNSPDTFSSLCDEKENNQSSQKAQTLNKIDNPTSSIQENREKAIEPRSQEADKILENGNNNYDMNLTAEDLDLDIISSSPFLENNSPPTAILSLGNEKENNQSSQEAQPTNEIDNPASSIQKNREDAIEPRSQETDKTLEHENNYISAAETLEKSPEITKENMPNVPTPFKKQLLYQKIGNNTKLEKKEKCLEEKEKRKKARLEKEQQKRILKEQNAMGRRKKGKATKITAVSSDSDTETEKKVVSTDFEIDVGDYVIVKYNEAHFPGCVTNILCEKQSKEYTVKAMESSGQNWRWPAKEDVLNYQRKDVIIKIEKPKIINKRGFYAVPELKDF
ncbi:unnamed protein product [Ceutorhynchus assimilis]|uniref:Uncharacterized protein n=1 Tax=Ceutorhynchus assimilis TaxID=467358 RepID=A0A9N9MIV7_9CUCU|nr:unnamed protein product [Ceutorhynchus assimilis]